MDKKTIFEIIKEILVSSFQIDAELISIEKRMEEDLSMDSLDMVEMLNCLKDYIGDKVKPDLFNNASTLQDVVDLVEPFWN